MSDIVDFKLTLNDKEFSASIKNTGKLLETFGKAASNSSKKMSLLERSVVVTGRSFSALNVALGKSADKMEDFAVSTKLAGQSIRAIREYIADIGRSISVFSTRVENTSTTIGSLISVLSKVQSELMAFTDQAGRSAKNLSNDVSTMGNATLYLNRHLSNTNNVLELWKGTTDKAADGLKNVRDQMDSVIDRQKNLGGKLLVDGPVAGAGSDNSAGRRDSSGESDKGMSGDLKNNISLLREVGNTAQLVTDILFSWQTPIIEATVEIQKMEILLQGLNKNTVSPKIPATTDMNPIIETARSSFFVMKELTNSILDVITTGTQMGSVLSGAIRVTQVPFDLLSDAVTRFGRASRLGLGTVPSLLFAIRGGLTAVKTAFAGTTALIVANPIGAALTAVGVAVAGLIYVMSLLKDKTAETVEEIRKIPESMTEASRAKIIADIDKKKKSIDGIELSLKNIGSDKSKLPIDDVYANTQRQKLEKERNELKRYEEILGRADTAQRKKLALALVNIDIDKIDNNTNQKLAINSARNSQQRTIIESNQKLSREEKNTQIKVWSDHYRKLEATIYQDALDKMQGIDFKLGTEVSNLTDDLKNPTLTYSERSVKQGQLIGQAEAWSVAKDHAEQLASRAKSTINSPNGSSGPEELTGKIESNAVRAAIVSERATAAAEKEALAQKKTADAYDKVLDKSDQLIAQMDSGSKTVVTFKQTLDKTKESLIGLSEAKPSELIPQESIDKAKENLTVLNGLSEDYIAMMNQRGAKQMVSTWAPDADSIIKSGLSDNREDDVTDFKDRYKTSLDGLITLRDNAMKELQKDPTQSANIDYFNKRIQKLVSAGNSALIGETGTVTQKLAVGYEDVAGQIETIWGNAFSNMTDTITDFMTNGKASFSDFARSIMKDITSVIVKSQITAPIMNMMGMGANGAGNTGNVAGSLLNQGVSLFKPVGNNATVNNGDKSIGQSAIDTSAGMSQMSTATADANSGISGMVTSAWDSTKSFLGLGTATGNQTKAIGSNIMWMNNLSSVAAGLTAVFATMGAGSTSSKGRWMNFGMSLASAAVSVWAGGAGANSSAASSGAKSNGFATTSTVSNGQNVPAIPKFEKGGIMGANGVIPLKTYSKGGIATSPQLALFGEGKDNEAYVPLPDGRSIPVTMAGSIGGGGTVAPVAISISVNSDGSSSMSGSDSDSSGWNDAAQRIKNIVLDTITQEKRPGGSLNKNTNGNR